MLIEAAISMLDNNFMLLNGVDPQPELPKKTKKKRRNRAGTEAAQASSSQPDVNSDSQPTATVPASTSSKSAAADDGFETVCHHSLNRDRIHYEFDPRVFPLFLDVYLQHLVG